MPHQAEGNANNVLGNLLRPMLGKAEVFFESTRVIAGQSGKRPDILITAPGRSPVVIEAEYDPARTVEPEARERLGMPVERATPSHRGGYCAALPQRRERRLRPARRHRGRYPVLLRLHRRRRPDPSFPAVRLAGRLCY